MFTTKTALLLSINLLLCSSIFASEMQEDDATRGKCKKFNSLTVCNSVTANSFITPSGPLFNGLRNWAVLTNQAAVNNTDNVLWAATPDANISSGITRNVDGTITLPTSGIFLVFYSVQFQFNGTTDPGNDASGTAALQQGSTDLNQVTIDTATINNNGASNALLISLEVTGYALISTASPSSNTINLNISLGGPVTLPDLTAGTSANAQMVILQLN